MTNKDKSKDDVFHPLATLIEAAFSDHYKEKPVTEVQPQVAVTNVPLYESIEDYKAKTGKRFRLKKDQKERGLTRDEAFAETYLSTNPTDN